METITTKEPVYKTETIKVGEEDKIIYKTMDGKEFTNKNQAVHHEEILNLTEQTKELFTEMIAFPDSYEEACSLVKMFFDTFDVSDIKCAKWIYTKDKQKIIKTMDYLNYVRYFGVDTHTLNKDNVEEGDEVLIFSWTEDSSSDFPSHMANSISTKDAVKKIKEDMNKYLNMISPSSAENL